MKLVYLYSGTLLLRLVVEMTSPTPWLSHLRPSSLLLSSHPPLSLWLLNTMWTILSVLWLPTVLGTVQLPSTPLVLVSWQHHWINRLLIFFHAGSCPVLTNPMNGAIGPVSSRLSGSTVTVQCDAGYVSPVTMVTCERGVQTLPLLSVHH